jgi:hypothetical protein
VTAGGRSPAGSEHEPAGAGEHEPDDGDGRGCAEGTERERERGRVHSHDGLRLTCTGAEPVVFAGRADLTLSPAAGRAALRGQVADVLAELNERLEAAGCTLVGHVKGSLDAAERGRLQFNVTALRGRASFHGDVQGDVQRAVLTLNVIVFGIGEAILADAVGGSLSVWAEAGVLWE